MRRAEAKAAKDKLGKEQGQQNADLLKRIAKLEKELKESKNERAKGNDAGDTMAI